MGRVVLTLAPEQLALVNAEIARRDQLGLRLAANRIAYRELEDDILGLIAQSKRDESQIVEAIAQRAGLDVSRTYHVDKDTGEVTEI